MIVKNKEDEFPALTGIRFLAVTMIFWHHNSDAVSHGFLHGIFNHLFLGVELFFVLSGFLICYKYYEPAQLDRSFLIRFFTRRFARVYPLYFLLTTFTFLFLYWEGKTLHLGGL